MTNTVCSVFSYSFYFPALLHSCLKRNTRNRLDELVQVILDRDRAKTLEVIRSHATLLNDSSKLQGTAL